MAIVTKLLHTRYRVDDLERTVKFYTKILGLTETRRHKSPRGSELVFLATPNSEEEIEICSYHFGLKVSMNSKNTSRPMALNTLMGHI